MLIKPRSIYLALSIIGLILPYSQMIPYSIEYGFDLITLFELQFSNPALSFFGFDLLIAAAAAVLFMSLEGARVKMKNAYVPIVLVFLIGLAFAFPLFLYMRELHLKR